MAKLTKKIKSRKSTSKAYYHKDRTPADLDKDAQVIVWDIADAASRGKGSIARQTNLKAVDFQDAVAAIVGDITVEVTRAVADANADTRITLSRASKRC